MQREVNTRKRDETKRGNERGEKMDVILFDEMKSSGSCWEGDLVFCARGLKFDVLPNPVFGVFPADCPRHKAAIFFTARSVSVLVQTTADDADIAVEDGLDTVSSIIEHHMPESKETANTLAVCMLEFRCLHHRFYFGVTPAVAEHRDATASYYDPLASPLAPTAPAAGATTASSVLKTFDALPSILHVYSPGLSYDRLVPMSCNALADAVAGQAFPEVAAKPLGEFDWTPKPPSESPPSSRKMTNDSDDKRKVGGGGRGGEGSASTTKTKRRSAQRHHGKESRSSDPSTAKRKRSISVERSESSSASEQEDDVGSNSSSASSSSSSGGYSNMLSRGRGTQHRVFDTNNNSNASFANRRLDLLGGVGSDLFLNNERQQQQQAIRDLLVLEAEDRCDTCMEQAAEMFAVAHTMQRNVQRICKAQVDATHAIHTSALSSRHSFTTYDGEDALAPPIPPSAREEPNSDAVRSFLENLEKSVRVRLGSYLVTGAGPQVLAQRQQLESAVMYRSLSEQLERLKSQNSALAVHLAQERRHVEDLELQNEEARQALAQAKAREAAILSRMRKRESEFSMAGQQQMQMHFGNDHDDN